MRFDSLRVNCGEILNYYRVEHVLTRKGERRSVNNGAEAFFAGASIATGKCVVAVWSWTEFLST